MDIDFIVVGGGIVGLSTAMHLLETRPGASLLVVEKENRIAAHQSSHNSGVIHSGIYYKPETLKAKFCRDGVERIIQFCRRHDVAFEQRGKLLVATDADEKRRMKEIYNRCCQNGFNDIQLLGADALKKRENHITGVAALYVPSTGIVSYANVAHAMAEVIEGNGGRVKTGDPVNEIREDRSGVTVTIGDETVRAKYLIACAGLMADRIARLCSLDFDFRIIPFRGEFYCLPSTKSNLVKHLIYPIPDPTLPFLGVHLTPTIDDNLIVGPNAVLAFNREGYRRYDFNARDILDMVGYRGFWKLLRTYLKPGIKEYWSSLSRRRYLTLCQKYCPILKEEDLQSYPSGVRAQAVLPDGTFPDDFLILNTPRTMHVCNAPSPAATSSIPIGQYLASKINTVFNLGKPHSPTT